MASWHYNRFFTGWLLLTATLLLTSSPLCACPRIGNLVDFNCDGKHKIVATGDSLIKGRGDLRFNNDGGYVKRIQRAYENSTVERLGFPGFTSERVYQRIKLRMESKRANKLRTQLLDADLLIIDVGRNDFFSHATPGITVRNISRLVKYLRRKLIIGGRTAPFIFVAALTPTTRGFQRSFIDNTNLMLYEFSSDLLPIRLPFNTLDESLISSDGIHPNSDGYTALFQIASEYIRGDAQIESASKRSDGDKDGIYDLFEQKKFGTDPKLTDTDSDTLKDGEEVFNFETDPLSVDSDADGFSDPIEINSGSDPLDALSFPIVPEETPTPTPEP